MLTLVPGIDNHTSPAPSKSGRSRLICPPPEDTLAPTIFHEPWWLEAASDGSYGEATVVADGALLGRLPFVMTKKPFGQTALVMPTLTHVLGPALSQTIIGDGTARSLKWFTVTKDLIDRLPAASHIWFELHRGTSNTLAFEAAGFSCGVNFTMDIEPDAVEALWRRMRDKTRNVIRRARDVLIVAEQFSPSQFMDFYEQNLREKGLRNSLDRRLSELVINACVGRGVGRLLTASDDSGAPKAAIFTAWDGRAEYFLMSTRRQDSTNGAISLLLWSAIQHAAALGLNFDVDRVCSKTNLLLLTGFGGILRPRYFVSRTTATYQIGRKIKTFFTGSPSTH